MKIIVTVLTFAAILIIGALLFIGSALYDVAATKPDYGIVRWLFQTTKNKSVSLRAKRLSVPNLDNESMVMTGFHHFDNMCVGCHGAPGITPSETGEGLYPEPPDLVETVRQMTPAELFWVTQNGIKMTGMPAFGPTHSNEELWGIVAFMQELPDLSPGDYQAMKNDIENIPHQHEHEGSEHNSRMDNQHNNQKDESAGQAEKHNSHNHNDDMEHVH